MIIKKIFESLCLTALVFGLFFNQPAAATTRGKVITDIGFVQEDNRSVITILFSVPIQYLRHSPMDYGKEIRVQVSPIVKNPAINIDLNIREKLFPPENNPAGVTRVEFAGRDVIEPTVTIVFKHARYYEVKQGEDFRSLSIIVPEPTSVKSDTDGREDSTISEKQQVQTEKAADRPSLPPLSQKRQDELLQEGELAMTREDFMRAVQIYTRLLDSTDPEILELAEFQLAQAQERQGYMAHARAEYRNYLDEFPEGPNSEEAEKQLNKLLGGWPGTGFAAGESLWQNEYYGSLGQYYERDVGYPEYSDGFTGPDSIVNYSTLRTEFDATYRLSTDRFYTSTVIVGSYENELEEGQDDRLRSNALYLEVEDYEETLYTSLGRQRINTGGVMGRFDGGVFGYRLSDTLKLNLVGGFPVDRSYDALDTDRYFYGLNFDVGRFFDHWDFNVYFINQIADSVEDRRALGLEVRYIGSQGSLFTLVDYDILYDELAVFLLSGNWLLANDLTRLYISADFRTNPILSTSNALIGQLSPTLEALVDALGEDTVEQLARDRTLDSSYVTVGISHPITSDVQISADISWSKLDGAPGSGGVEEIESLGDEWYYSLQLNGTNLLMKGDLSTVALRYNDTERRDTYSLLLNSSYPYPIIKGLRFLPKFRIDYRSNKELSGDQWQIRPGAIVEYAFSKHWLFEVEGEYRWANQELTGLAEDKEGYYLSVGFTWSF